jgi:site-specific DNA-methyltransferase (adenine-specific)
VAKAYRESLRGVTSVLLLPSSTDTAWFYDWVLPFAEIRFVRGRIRFVGQDNPAPFGSVVCIFRPREEN